MNVRKTIFIITFILLLFLFLSFSYGQDYTSDIRKLIVFYSPTCHKCIQIKNELMPDIEKEFKGRIEIVYRDISDIENYKFLLSLQEKDRKKIKIVLPVFYLEGNFLNGKQDIENNLKPFIIESLGSPIRERHLPTIDLVARFKNFTLFAVIGLGLIDGVNPCAFTVIVFFISFLALQGYRKKELIVIGLWFISAVFLTYLLIGLGIFNFLYKLNEFWLARKIIFISIGIFTILLGILAIYDFLKFKKTGQTEGLLLQLPQSIKNRIHYVIGLHYRKTKSSQSEQPKQQKHFFRLTITALITGFLVSILEAVCTGQTYLPTITFILKTTHLKLQALGYLLVYNFMFIAPLLIIFFFALLGTTSEQFSDFLKKHLLAIKILMAIIFFGLGIFLIWRR